MRRPEKQSNKAPVTQVSPLERHGQSGDSQEHQQGAQQSSPTFARTGARGSHGRAWPQARQAFGG